MSGSLKPAMRPLCGYVVAVIVLGGLFGTVSRAASSTLPDERQYELVSPSTKNGADVSGDPTKTRAAADGGALAFASLGAFSDVRGTGLVAQYLSRRDEHPGTSGWSTHGISPVQGPMSFAGVANGVAPLYYGEFAPDLSKGVLGTNWPLADAPNVLGIGNLYLRTDLLTPGAGSYQLLTNASDPVGFQALSILTPTPAGTSADFSHVVFESVAGLTPDAPTDQSMPLVYEWDHGTVRLAGVLPDGSPAPASIAGGGTGLRTIPTSTPNVISQDGRRIFFIDRTTGTGANDGTLYMRVDHTSTVQINASEKVAPESPGSAIFQGAAPDGSRVFFTTAEGLTEDDVDGAVDLYMYDMNAPAGQHLTWLSVDNQPADDDGRNFIDGVIGASDDGHYVYFLSVGQLVAGKPPFTSPDGIFLWHDGTISYIGEMHDLQDQDRMLGKFGRLDPKSSRVSPNGKSILFVSQSGVGLGGHDQGSCPDNSGLGGCQETYLYQADRDLLTCVSCPSSGPSTANSSPVTPLMSGAAGRGNHLNHPLSDDGKRVVFTSGEALVPQDRNGAVRDVYEYDVLTGKLHLISSGTSLSDSFFLDASRSGNDVFFATRDRLTGWDFDDNYDIYDARVGGGFPEPVKARVCVASSCHEALSSEEPAPALGSTTIVGKHRVTYHGRKHCTKGHVRRRMHGKARCVRSKKHRRSGIAGQATHHGGTR